MTIGDRIKARRLELNLTLEDVSKVVRITRQTVQKYESGIVSNIPSDKIELLAKALEVSPGYLMGWEQISIPNPEVQQREKPATPKGDGLKSDELELISAFRSAPQSTQEAIRLLLKGK